MTYTQIFQTFFTSLLSKRKSEIIIIVLLVAICIYMYKSTPTNIIDNATSSSKEIAAVITKTKTIKVPVQVDSIPLEDKGLMSWKWWIICSVAGVGIATTLIYFFGAGAVGKGVGKGALKGAQTATKAATMVAESTEGSTTTLASGFETYYSINIWLMLVVILIIIGLTYIIIVKRLRLLSRNSLLLSVNVFPIPIIPFNENFANYGNLYYQNNLMPPITIPVDSFFSFLVQPQVLSIISMILAILYAGIVLGQSSMLSTFQRLNNGNADVKYSSGLEEFTSFNSFMLISFLALSVIFLYIIYKYLGAILLIVLNLFLVCYATIVFETSILIIFTCIITLYVILAIIYYIIEHKAYIVNLLSKMNSNVILLSMPAAVVIPDISATDTSTLAHLISFLCNRPILSTMALAIIMLITGTYIGLESGFHRGISYVMQLNKDNPDVKYSSGLEEFSSPNILMLLSLLTLIIGLLYIIYKYFGAIMLIVLNLFAVCIATIVFETSISIVFVSLIVMYVIVAIIFHIMKYKAYILGLFSRMNSNVILLSTIPIITTSATATDLSSAFGTITYYINLIYSQVNPLVILIMLVSFFLLIGGVQIGQGSMLARFMRLNKDNPDVKYSSGLEELDFTYYHVIIFSIILVIVIYVIYKVIVYSLPVILIIASVSCFYWMIGLEITMDILFISLLGFGLICVYQEYIDVKRNIILKSL